MHTPEARSGANGVGAAAKEVAEHASALARLEMELAGFELKRKATAIGIGAALGLAAALVGLYAIGFMFATIAAALATFLPWWLSLLAMTVALFVVVGVLGLFALRAFKRGTPPVPEQAIREAKETTEALKS